MNLRIHKSYFYPFNVLFHSMHNFFIKKIKYHIIMHIFNLFLLFQKTDKPSLDCLVKLSQLCQSMALHQDFGAGEINNEVEKGERQALHTVCMFVRIYANLWMNANVHVCKCVYVCACVRVCVHACVHRCQLSWFTHKSYMDFLMMALWG